MQVLLVISTIGLCMATTLLIADTLLRVLLNLCFARAGAVRREVVPGRAEAHAAPVGVWHRGRA